MRISMASLIPLRNPLRPICPLMRALKPKSADAAPRRSAMPVSLLPMLARLPRPRASRARAPVSEGQPAGRGRSRGYRSRAGEHQRNPACTKRAALAMRAGRNRRPTAESEPTRPRRSFSASPHRSLNEGQLTDASHPKGDRRLS